MPTVDKLVAGYRLLRAQKKAIQDKHKQELAPYNAKLYKLEAGLLAILNRAGADNIKTPDGTVYKTEITTAKVVDFDTMLDYVIKNDVTGLLERRVSTQAVQEYMEEHGSPPPGVSISTETFARVRK